MPRQVGRALEALVASGADQSQGDSGQVVTDEEIRQLERRNIVAALRLTKWKIGGAGGAAELLAIRPTTLASRMKSMRIERPS